MTRLDLARQLHDLADRVATLPSGEIVGALAAMMVDLLLTAPAPAPPETADRLLTIDEASERLSVTRDWLRHRRNLPFVVKLSDGVVRYSARRIEEYIAGRLASDT